MAAMRTRISWTATGRSVGCGAGSNSSSDGVRRLVTPSARRVGSLVAKKPRFGARLLCSRSLRTYATPSQSARLRGSGGSAAGYDAAGGSALARQRVLDLRQRDDTDRCWIAPRPCP